MNDYRKEVEEAKERWADEWERPEDPATICMNCTPIEYWRSNHCSKCPHDRKVRHSYE